MPHEDAIVGKILDEKYRVEERLGRGGMGAVYLAKHLGTGRLVALKIIAPELTQNEGVIARFRREARAAGQIRHPNVVNVTDFGFAAAGGEQVAYLVMERLRGETLADLLERESKLPLGKALNIVQQVASAVEEAHKHGIVHRDLKPENIWLEPSPRRGYTIKVLDFGVAKLHEAQFPDIHAANEEEDSPSPAETMEDDAPPLSGVNPDSPTLAERVSEPGASTLASCTTLASEPPSVRSGKRLKREESITQAGVLLGTPFYMSPEQWLHRSVDARSDVYSLGVLVYRMLAGEVPFNGTSAPIALQHIRYPPPPLLDKAPSIPPGVAAVVMKALAKAPDDRPPSAQSFAAALSAGAESAGSLIGRAMALTAMHFPSLLGLNIKVFTAPLFVTALRVLVRRLASAHVLSPKLSTSLGLLLSLAYMAGLWFLQPLSLVVSTEHVRDLSLAPHDPPRHELTLSQARRYLRVTFVPTLMMMLGILVTVTVTREPLFYLGAYLKLFRADGTDLRPAVILILEAPSLIVATLLFSRFVVYPPVAVLEQTSGLAALRRSAELTRPFRRAASIILGLHVLFRSLIVWILWLTMAQLANVPFITIIDSFNDSIYTDVWILLIPCLQLVAWTFTFTAAALLYLNSRHMEGVTLEALAPTQPPATSRPPPPMS